MASLIEKFNGLVDEVEKVSEGNPIKNLGNKKAKPFKKKNEGGGVCMNQGQNGECTAGCETLKAAEPCNATDDQTKCSCYKAPTSEAADEEDDKDKEDDDSKDKEDSDDTDSDAKDDTEDDKDKEDDEEKDESVPFFRKNDTIRVSRQHESGCSTKKKKKNEEDDEEDSDKDGDDDSSDDTDTDDEEDKEKDDEINDKDEVANTVDSDLIDKITATKKKYTEDEFDDYLSKIDSKIDGAVYDNTVAALKKSGVIKESNVKRHDEALDYQGGDVYEMQDGTMHIVIDNDPASFRSVSFAPLDDNIGAAVSGLDLGSNSISSWVDSEAFDGNVATFVGNFAEYTPPEIVNAEVVDGADPGTMESKKNEASGNLTDDEIAAANKFLDNAIATAKTDDSGEVVKNAHWVVERPGSLPSIRSGAPGWNHVITAIGKQFRSGIDSYIDGKVPSINITVDGIKHGIYIYQFHDEFNVCVSATDRPALTRMLKG